MIRLIALTCALALAATAPAVAQTSMPAAAPASLPAAYGPPLGLAEAQALVQRALDNAHDQGLTIAVAVVEPTGELVAFARMDNAAYGTIPLAQAKARTAARFRVTTAAQEERSGQVGSIFCRRKAS
ncbi:MAG: heme-binding protein [Oxalobacteraceae bacterium]|nr:MAG: heme-binding protein [Oxalobacteraceae bacterium]